MTDITLNRRLMLSASMAASSTLIASHSADAAAPGLLIVIAEIIAKPDYVEELRKVLIPFADRSRQENGCLSYALYEGRGHPGHFFTYEIWSSEAALTTHLNSPAMKAAGPKLAPMLAEPPAINKLTTLSAG